jgi:hypothetical protein
MNENIVPIRKPTVSSTIPFDPSLSQTKKEETKYPSTSIPLPTRGHFYAEGHPLSCGTIELKEMTAREEDILANPELIKKGKVLEKLLESLIIDKSIKIGEIFIPDTTAIFLSIRRFAYGDEYSAIITCPSCNQQNKVNINLGELKFKPFDFDNYPKGQNVFSYTLPNSKKTITYKLLNQIDNDAIDAEITSLKKMSKDISKDLTTRLIYMITSIDGNYDKQSIRKFVDDELKANDSYALRKHVRETNPDIDMSFDFACNNCNYERRVDIPIGASFLWPDVDSGR